MLGRGSFRSGHGGWSRRGRHLRNGHRRDRGSGRGSGRNRRGRRRLNRRLSDRLWRRLHDRSGWRRRNLIWVSGRLGDRRAGFVIRGIDDRLLRGCDVRRRRGGRFGGRRLHGCGGRGGRCGGRRFGFCRRKLSRRCRRLGLASACGLTRCDVRAWSVFDRETRIGCCSGRPGAERQSDAQRHHRCKPAHDPNCHRESPRDQPMPQPATIILRETRVR